jgi:protein required for attachment to host cells
MTSPSASAIDASPLADRRLHVLAMSAAALVVTYATAASLGASSTALNLILTGAVGVVAVLGWGAYAKAPLPIRPMCSLLAPAATCWFVGTLVWDYYFIAGGGSSSPPLGPWDPIFVGAYVLALAAVLVGMRTVISLRHAALDASVIVAAGLALGAVGQGLENGISLDSLGTLVRPTLGIVMLTLIVSAGLGAWQGLPLSLVLFGVGQVCLTLGGLVYTFSVVEDDYVDLRWTGIGIASGAAFSIVAAGVIVLGIDRPVRLVTETRIPRHAVGAKGVLYAALGALATTLGVAFYGHFSDNGAVFAMGLLTSGWVGAAMAFRARNSIREVEQAYVDLDHAHLALERAHDELAEANDELARTNVEIRAVHAAFEDLLVIADERTHGGLRELIEETGEDLAEFLRRYRADDS